MDSREVRTGADLKVWRGGRSQAEIAVELKVSQRMISACESLPKKLIPKKILARLHGENLDSGIESSSHSWPLTLWKSLHAKSLKQADEVRVRAIISPSSEGSQYADFVAELQYESLIIPEGQVLAYDHVRDPGDDRTTINFPGEKRSKNAQFQLVLGGTDQMPESMQVMSGKKHEVLVRQGEGALLLAKRTDPPALHIDRTVDFGSVRARVVEDNRMHAPNFLAYELKADQRDPVKVYVRSDEGFNTSTSDAVGFTYYTEADFIVERIRLEVEFRGGLTPVPDPPSARAQLIRRTSVRPNSLHPTFPNPTKSDGSVPNSIKYTFGPLLRPKGGYLYSLVWNSIARLQTR